MKEIIEKAVSELLDQRARLLDEMAGVNFNEPNYPIKQMMYENQIAVIDMNIQNLLMNINQQQ